jgi:hypothetical protein
MRSKTKKRLTAVLTLVLAIGVGVVAVAYWTSTGSGSGSGVTADPGAQSVTVNQTSSSTGLAPGGSVALAGNVANPAGNSNSVHVNTINGTAASVDTAHATAGCNAAWYSVTGGPVTVNADVAAGSSTAWSGLSLAMTNAASSQDACKGATITVTYSTT